MPQVQLPAHMDLHVKGGVDGGRQQYKCDFCDYASTKKENLARHKYLRGHGQGDSQGANSIEKFLFESWPEIGLRFLFDFVMS